MIKEKAYAKINLTLDVIKKREDGYHDLRSVMTPITLYDELYFTDADVIELESEVQIENNIILKAAFLLKKLYNVKKGAHIKLIKRIFVSAGLAGGSADASATLRGLNKLWRLGLSIQELAKISEQLGSDTIFCTYNRLAYIEGRGEKVNFISSNIDSYCLLIKPYFGVSTKDVFQNHKICYESDQKFRDFMTNVDNTHEPLKLYNDLMNTTFNLYPELKELYDKLYKEDSSVMMSGSGPTLYILSNDHIHLNDIYRKFVACNRCQIVKLGVIE